MKVAVAVALLLVSIPARAETDYADTPPGATAPVPFAANPIAPPAQPAQPKATGLDAVQLRAASNRGLVGSTALTVPEGKVELSLQAIAPFAGIASLNTGITRSTELWIDGATTLQADDYDGSHETAYGVGVKQVLLRDRKLAFALTGSVRRMSSYGSGHGWTSLGGVGTLCLDDSCAVIVSGAVQHLFGYHEGYDGSSSTGETAVTLGISAGNATTRFLVDTITLEGHTLGFVGLRLGNQSGAFDFGFARALGESGGEETVPWVGLTGRL